MVTLETSVLIKELNKRKKLFSTFRIGYKKIVNKSNEPYSTRMKSGFFNKRKRF